jgi:hypothetical protein
VIWKEALKLSGFGKYKEKPAPPPTIAVCTAKALAGGSLLETKEGSTEGKAKEEGEGKLKGKGRKPGKHPGKEKSLLPLQSKGLPA